VHGIPGEPSFVSALPVDESANQAQTYSWYPNKTGKHDTTRSSHGEGSSLSSQLHALGFGWLEVECANGTNDAARRYWILALRRVPDITGAELCFVPLYIGKRDACEIGDLVCLGEILMPILRGPV